MISLNSPPLFVWQTDTITYGTLNRDDNDEVGYDRGLTLSDYSILGGNFDLSKFFMNDVYIDEFININNLLVEND